MPGRLQQRAWSWNKVLEPHIRKPDQPKANIPVVYSDTKKYAVYERGFREIRLLENLSEHLSDRFAWPKPFSVVMEECGEPGARWDLSDRKIHVCYELAADFGSMYRDSAASAEVAEDGSEKAQALTAIRMLGTVAQMLARRRHRGAPRQRGPK